LHAPLNRQQRSKLSDRILSRACPISTKFVKVPEFAGVSNPLSVCCLASNELSYSVETRLPTITLSGTAQDLSKSLFLFFLVRLPASGMLVHPCSCPSARKSRPLPHRPLRKWYRRTVRIRCQGLEIVRGPTQAIVSAGGPSRAGRISKRVVKPDAPRPRPAT